MNTCKECKHFDHCNNKNDYLYYHKTVCAFFVNASRLVEVVRCHECRFSGEAFDPFEGKTTTFCIISRDPVPADHFCGYGLRKEDPE